MPEEFDLPIDGDFETPAGEGRAAISPRRRRTAAASTRKRAVKRSASSAAQHDRDFEEVATPLRARPRISIDAATHAPRRVNLYRRLALSFFAATVLVIGVIIFFTFQHTSITVAQDAIPLAAQFSAIVANDAAAVTASTSTSSVSQVFQGMVTTVTTSTEKTFVPSVTSDKPGKSHATIMVHNTGALPQSLVATTRFLSESGVLFRAVNAVIVPAHGLVKAEIAADKLGADGDVLPGKFTIPGLSAAQQKIVYGESSASAHGGNGKIGVVSQADIDKASEAVRKNLFEIGQNTLTAVKVPDGDELLYTPVNIKVESSAKAGDKVDQFTVTVSGTMAFVAYPKASVFAAADREVQNKLPTPYHKMVFVNDAPIVSLQSIDVATKIAVLQIYREGKALLDARSAAFQSAQFIGRSKQEIIDQIKTIKGVKDVQVTMFPMWLDRAPKVPERIQVEISE